LIQVASNDGGNSSKTVIWYPWGKLISRFIFLTEIQTLDLCATNLATEMPQWKGSLLFISLINLLCHFHFSIINLKIKPY
jgi:hypothetical protein